MVDVPQAQIRVGLHQVVNRGYRGKVLHGPKAITASRDNFDFRAAFPRLGKVCEPRAAVTHPLLSLLSAGIIRLKGVFVFECFSQVAEILWVRWPCAVPQRRVQTGATAKALEEGPVDSFPFSLN
jgi:hypothetical protein